MKLLWTLASTIVVAAVVAVLVWLGGQDARDPAGEQPETAPADGPVLRIGLIPERDVFQLHKRYVPLAKYLESKIGRRVELLTVNTYEGILRDFEEKSIDGAFLGSLVAVLAMDRYDVHVLAKPELADGTSTYRGVIFTRADSPIKDLVHLAGRSIAMVRTTTAGNLCPCFLLIQHGLMDKPDPPAFVWVGTHDDVANAVMAKRVDAGAIKSTRLDALLRENPDWQIRRLVEGGDVPSNALLLREQLVRELGPAIREALLGMARDRAGLRALAAMGARRFLPCTQSEYAAIYDMVDALGPAWAQVGIDGPPPVRPPDQP